MDQVPAIRETELKRRRSRVPWIYLVYHCRLRTTGLPRRLPRQSRGAATAGSGGAAKAGDGGASPKPRSGDRGHHPSCCRRRNAGTSSGDTGSNSAPGLIDSSVSPASAGAAAGTVAGISSR
jgi:hypothetical protein